MNSAPRTGWLSLALNLAGVALVGYALFASFAPVIAPALVAIGTVGLVAWLVSLMASIALTRGVVSGAPSRHLELPPALPGAPAGALPRVILVTLTVAALCGAFIAGPTLGLGIALTVAALIRTIGTVQWPLWWGLLLGVVSAALVAVGAVVTSSGAGLSADLSPGGLLAIEGGIVISALGGLSRRQFRLAELQAEHLREEHLVAVEKQAALTALSDRQGIAREIHDVLAHSLGGLVIQLDAVDALLEAGQTDAAADRIHDARRLAASGLAEARRAVDALREPDASSSVSPAALLTSFDELVSADRALGSVVTLTVHSTEPAADDGLLSGEAAHALRRTLQEALTNARKHAAGAAVDVQVEVAPSAVLLRVANPLAAPRVVVGSSGGSRGIAGMRERFATLPGATLSVEAEDGTFVVTATAMLLS
ncbi:sensor histidine kinase [Subtercola endophyticus]|uniref:sensor histidine kinase n=1 Tax=Subtercola endophyticus TaxID=2895559 RepID=UPI001E3D8229|nr:histidine kinase [Subtercola endophyticus]UFS59737.1 histidine kinase [Subtercola endophyticus]